MATKVLFRAEDLEELQLRREGRKLELIRGELYETTVTVRHSAVQMRIAYLLERWNESARAGNVLGEAGFTFKRSPDTVRTRDVCFVSKGRLAGVDTRDGYPEIAPDLAIDVRSPNDTLANLRRKAEQFREHGTRVVVIVEPDKYAELLRLGESPKRLEPNDEFEIPGGRTSVASVDAGVDI